MDISLSGKTALVSGSSQGIGKAIAIELSLLGASCVLLARNMDALIETMNELDTSKGQKHLCFSVDYNDSLLLQSIVNEITQKNEIDILVNNTGGPAAGMIQSADIQAFENAFRQHLIANQILAQHVIPSMKRKGFGRIINIISTSVRIPIDNLGVSNTIRAAVASWSKTLSNEVAQYGITVNSLLPGFISTQRLEQVATNFAQMASVSKEEMQDKMKSSVPARRFGNPSEIAAVAAFLASPAASYVNGVALPVDGGRTGSI